MDDRRFDQLAKAIAGESGSRRLALRLTAGSAIAVLLGFFGMADKPAVARHNNRHGRRNRDRDGDGDGRRRESRKVCHCGDTPDNCTTKPVTKRGLKRHLRKHSADYKGECNKDNNRGCTDAGAACDISNQGACCANKCCSVNPGGGGTSGVCPTSRGTCCTARAAGGYCTAEFPQCCGALACCEGNQVCCIGGGNGYCCGAGQSCHPSGVGCSTPQGASVEAQSAGRREGRR